MVLVVALAQVAALVNVAHNGLTKAERALGAYAMHIVEVSKQRFGSCGGVLGKPRPPTILLGKRDEQQRQHRGHALALCTHHLFAVVVTL